LRERAAEAFEPSPFFQTRVLAALRERQAAGNVSPLRRLWRTAGALVSAMAVTVAALAALTFVAPPAEQTTTAQETATVNAYTVDDILFEQNDLADAQLSNDQVLTTLYAPDDDTGK
jgi:hypothetical protein